MYSYFWLVSDISNYVSISVSKNNPGPIQKSKHAVHLHVKNKVQFAFTYIFKMCSKMKYFWWKLQKIDITLGIDLSPQHEKLSFKIQV